MEAAIRWSANEPSDSQRFLIADIGRNSLQYCEVEAVQASQVKYKVITARDKLPNFTAFDWSRDDSTLVAIGTSTGECKILSIDPESTTSEFCSFPVKLQRKCNSLAFSRNNLLAVGLDRIRGDTSLNIHDLSVSGSISRTEPFRRLTGAEVITNVKFFTDQPQTLVAGSGGIARQGQSLKLYDLRDQNASSSLTVPTRHVHYLSIDPLDDNYFASAGPSGDNAVSIWDRRVLSRGTAASLTGQTQATAVLEVRPVIDPASQASIWSLRYSGYKRGAFAVLSSTGQARLFETSSFQGKNNTSSDIYMQQSHQLRPSGTDQRHGEDQSSRPIAFDFARPGSIHAGECLLTIRQNRNLEYVGIPQQPSVAEISSLNDFGVVSDGDLTVAYRSPGQSIADDLLAIQAKVSLGSDGEGSTRGSVDLTNGDYSVGVNQRSLFSGDQANLSSRERHEDVAGLSFPGKRLPISDMAITLDTQRRRCKEGYLFDCDRNASVVKNDPWLVELWDVVKRLGQMSNNSGMSHKGLDFAYYGVHGIWFAKFDPASPRVHRRQAPSRKEFSNVVTALLARQRYSKFEGADTEYASLRKLGLAICGWKFDEKRLREKCSEIIGRREYYKALVVAVCHGRRDIAIDLLKSLTRTKALQNSGLAAVIACTSITDEQRELCGWMADEAEDPYLKALLSYFVSGSWDTVVAMTELPLLYRVAVALKYLDDEKLSEFLESATTEAVENGDTEGIVLTGLTEPCMDLFQNYISKYNDLQTAVLATSFAYPRYISDPRWTMWKDTYFDQMQAWRAFTERLRFSTQHSRLLSSQGSGPKPVAQHNANVTLRCMHCQKSVAPRAGQDEDSSEDDATGVHGSGRRGEAGFACPHCGKRFSRCAICMLWQGAPRLAVPAVARDKDGGAKDQETFAGFVSLCLTCKHGYHVDCARKWFDLYQTCPSSGCQCHCTSIH